MAVMDGFDEMRTDAELRQLELRLQEQAPRATGLELDRIRLRAMSAPSRGRATRRSELMRSRIAVTAMLAAGFLFAGTGAGLAVSGISGAGSAATHEYPTEAVGGQQGEQQILGETAAGKTQSSQSSQSSQGIEAAQAARQVAATGGGGGLPFTGFAAIPLLLAGIGLTGTGFVFRRAARD
jgi:hypothetical protein